ncbi:MAG: chondroitin lyase [Saprospiraceae bacterium]|nr:chondroitin lyase [Saprospiraceae bacterium]
MVFLKKVIVIVLGMAVCMQAITQSNDVEIIRTRVVEELMKTEVNDSEIQEILDRMTENGSFSDINYLDLSRTAGFPHRRHTYDLVKMARAYQYKGSSFYQDAALKRRIVDGLTYWVEHDFFGDNWHNNQISTPTNLVNLMLLIGDELPKDLVEGAQPMIGRAHMNASGARPSGDRIVIAGILAKNLLFLDKKKEFDEIIRLIEGEVKFSTGKRGMQHDYSFHHRHDRVNNTVSYGYGKYANAFGEWSYYVANTEYQFSIEKINHLIDYYLDGIYKQLVYGVYTDVSVKNRSITHKVVFEPKGALEIERLLFSSDYRKDELEEIMQLRRGLLKPSRSFCKFFWQTEHLVFQRPNFYTTVRMYSTRNRNMEVPYNGPGKPTHHRADGTNYLMLRGDEYHNIWPVYDWQKISGTTVLQKPSLHPPEDIQKDGLTDFVGAVTDGLYGAAAFDFRSPHDLVKAKKAWFFFDSVYVCLGNNVAAQSRLSVATTINQALMRSEVLLTQGGAKANLPRGSHAIEKADWIHHDKVGYVFPQPTDIHVSNQTEEGRWSDITDQKNISDELVSKDVFKIWYDHGRRPQDESYEYLVVPDISADAMPDVHRSKMGIQILENSDSIQAVKQANLDIIQACFYRAGKLEFTPELSLEMRGQGMVMLEMDGSVVQKLTVSDPSRQLSHMLLAVSGNYQIDNPNVEVVDTAKKDVTILSVALPRGVYAGKSVVVDF